MSTIIKYIIAILCIGLSLIFMQDLKKYNDIVTISLPIEKDILELEVLNKMDVTTFSVINRYRNISIYQDESLINDVSIYVCDNAFFEVVPFEMLYGDFDLDGEKKLIIDSEIAWQLFSYVDCVGQKVNLYGEDYTVAGVYKKSKFNLLASREQYILYMSNQPKDIKGYEREVVFKCKNGMAAITLMQTGYLKPFRQVNIDAMVRFANFLSTFLICLSAIFIFLRNIKLLWYEVMNRTSVNILSLTWCLITLIILIYFVTKLNFVVDTRLVPSTLIDMKEFIIKIQNWLIDVNNGEVVGGIYYFEVKIRALLGVVFSFIAFALLLSIKKCKTLQCNSSNR